MPVPARRVPSGTIVVDPPGGDGSGRTVAYVRVSSHDRWPDLEAKAGMWRRGARDRAMRAVTAAKCDLVEEVVV